MNETKRVALARYAARGKQYIVLIRPLEQGLAMQQLRYYDEIRGFDEVPLGEAEVKATEIQLAVQLIDQIASEKFRPERYEDEVKARVQEAVDLKIAGQEVTVTAPDMPKAQIIDLMDALKASLGRGDADAPKPAASVSPKAKRLPAKRAAPKKASKKSSKGKAKASKKTGKAKGKRRAAQG